MDNILQSLGPGGPTSQGYACGDAPSLGRESGEPQDETRTSALLKSGSLTRPRVRRPEVKERPSSYCYEDERRKGEGEMGGGEGEREVSSPPQPPTRKDSFRATRGCSGVTDVKVQRCIPDPVGIPSLSHCYAEDDDDNLLNIPGVPGNNGYPATSETSKTEGNRNGNRVGNFKGDSLEQYYTLISKKKSSRKDSNSVIQNSHPDPLSPLLPASEISSTSPISSPGPPDTSIDPEPLGEPSHLLPQNKHSSLGLYRHSAPEKLLSQLRLLEFSSDSSDPSDRISASPSSSQWSHSPFHPTRENLSEDLGSNNAPVQLQQNQGKWGEGAGGGGSRCSSPGLVNIDGVREAREMGLVVGGAAATLLSPIQLQHPWARSLSVPGSEKPSGGCNQGGVSSERVRKTDFGPLSAAASVDSLIEENLRGGGREERRGEREDDDDGEVLMKKPRSHRSSRSRRRSERFATNLRNEIQRKKAQLSKSKGPGGLLYGGETVEEEEGPDLEDLQREEADDLKERCSQERCSEGRYTSSDDSRSAPAPGSLLASTSTPQLYQLSPTPVSALQPLRNEDPEPPEDQDQASDPSRTTQRLVPAMPSCDVGTQVVEEQDPAGLARRWRWTPEHHLQLEMDTDRQGERVTGALGLSGRGRATSSSSSTTTRSSRTEECDVLPFADRCKFFEETSRSMSVWNLPGLTSRRQRPDRHGRQPHPSTLENQGGGYGQGKAQRRYSYQGGIQKESPLSITTMETQRGREKEREREKEGRERREEREKERRERRRERAKRGEREGEERDEERRERRRGERREEREERREKR
ncbi:unnamed protein product, partial [Oncorhynchus mykiss]